MPEIKNLTEIDIKSSVLHLAVPMMAGGLLQNLFSMVDLFFVGRLGHIALAGLSVAAMVVMIIIVGINGVTTGTVALISYFTGKKEYGNANIVLWQTVFLSLLLWVVLIFVGLHGVDFLLDLFGADREVAAMAYPYLRNIFLYSGVIFLYVTITQSMRGSGDAKTPLKILVFANLINIILDPLLIFGIGPFPRLEVAGSAYATIISYFSGLVVSILFLAKKRDGLRFTLRGFCLNIKFIKRICKIGFFASLQMLITNISLLALTRLVSSYGPEALAAYGIGSKIKMLLIVPCFAFANAASILMGQNMGAGREERASRSLWLSVGIFQLLMIPVVVLLFIYAPGVVSIFNDNHSVVAIGGSYIRFIMATVPFLGLTLVMTRGLSGIGDTAFPTLLIAIFTLFLRIGGAYSFSSVLDMGTSGIWFAINISDVLLALSLVIYFNTGRWRSVYLRHRFLIEGF